MTERDDAIKKVIQELADYGGSPDYACGCCKGYCDSRTQCSFCGKNAWGEEHYPDCVVLLARAVREQTT